MRIISGKYKARRITAPKNLPVRPTTDMSKESLFNILNHHFNFTDLRVLDLFSGTGNISYEFASRGAESVTSVDQHVGCIQFIRQTAKAFEMEINPVKSEVFSFLEKNSQKYDIIFADPPYDMPENDFKKIVNIIFENEFLEEDGMLIIEHSTHTDLTAENHFVEKRKYGSSVFSFFEWDREDVDKED